jgi:hypothetical protein
MDMNENISSPYASTGKRFAVHLFPKSTNYNLGSGGKTMIAVENPPTNASNIDRGTCPGLCRGKKKGEKSL